MENKHTPTPWKIKDDYTPVNSFVEVVSVERGCVVAECEEWEDAEFIVTAVNAHKALVAALEEVETYLDDRADVDDGIPNTAMRLLQDVRAALAQVKKG